MRGGVPRIEVTLRTAGGVEAVERIAKALPNVLLGAGTVLNAEHIARVVDAGAHFVVSPGLTPKLIDAAQASSIPLLGGIATASELMLGLEAGLTAYKFFPAEASGGVAALKAFAGPFASARFCPTGGVTLATAPSYLALDNVMCVGGSWVVPGKSIAREDWVTIEALAREASRLFAKL